MAKRIKQTIRGSLATRGARATAREIFKAGKSAGMSNAQLSELGDNLIDGKTGSVGPARITEHNDAVALDQRNAPPPFVPVLPGESVNDPLLGSAVLGSSAVTVPDPVDGAIAWHDWLVPHIQTLARSASSKDAGDVAANARDIWPHLHSARVFAIPQVTWISVYRWADHHTNDLAGLEWLPPKEEKPDVRDSTDGETVRYLRFINHQGPIAPWPNRLPFESVLLVYGSGVSLSAEQCVARAGKLGQLRISRANLVAHLVTAGGMCWEFIVAMRKEDNAAALIFHEVHSPTSGKWSEPLSLNPWTVPATVDLINSFKALVREHYRVRRARDDERRPPAPLLTFAPPRRPLPPPYYRLELRHELIEERKRHWSKAGARRAWKLAHRCDVRGHERVRVMRGPLPIKDDVEADLRARGYRVFTANAPPATDPAWRLLAERHERPKETGEWLAVKVTWVRDHVRGPADAPYIPAVRTLPSGMEAP